MKMVESPVTKREDCVPTGSTTEWLLTSVLPAYTSNFGLTDDSARLLEAPYYLRGRDDA